MNDPISDLAHQTIETIQRDGWIKGTMGGMRTGEHCLLGSIGKARWGEQWEADCNRGFAYDLLKKDATARGLVHRLVNIIVKISEAKKKEAIKFAHTYREPSTKQILNRAQEMVYSWNDTEASEEAVLTVLREAAKGEK
jgi:hypothetical protein